MRETEVGYLIADLMRDLEHFLGYGTRNRAVLIGVGNLGLALLSYGGFADYGLNIVAAFDNKSALIGSAVDGRPVLDIQALPAFCQKEIDWVNDARNIAQTTMLVVHQQCQWSIDLDRPG